MKDNASVALMVESGIIPMLLACWFGSAIFFYAFDRKYRFDTLLLSERTKRTCGGELLLHFSILINFIYLLSLLMAQTVPWSFSELRTISEIIFFNFRSFSSPEIIIPVFWCFVGASGLLVLTSICFIVYDRLGNQPPGKFLTSAYTQMPSPHLWFKFDLQCVFLDIFLIPSFVRFMQILNCHLTLNIHPDNVSYLVQIKTQICWSGTHIIMGSLGVVSLMIVYISALFIASTTHYHPFNHKRVYIPKFRLLYVFLQLPLAFLSIVVIYRPIINAILTELIFIVLTTITIVMKPCKGDEFALNYSRTAAFSGASWGGLCAICCILRPGGEAFSHIPTLLFLIGTPIVVLFTWVAQWKYCEVLHRRRLNKIVQFFSTQEWMGTERAVHYTSLLIDMTLISKNNNEILQIVLDRLLILDKKKKLQIEYTCWDGCQ